MVWYVRGTQGLRYHNTLEVSYYLTETPVVIRFVVEQSVHFKLKDLVSN